MNGSTVRCLMSTETECLTLHDSEHGLSLADVVSEFLSCLWNLAPSLRGPAGLFNPYGRIYLDGSHVELAYAECANPFTLVQVIAAQQQLAARAVAELQESGVTLGLSNCNHSGLLRDDAPTWGSHGNYLVQENPSRLAERLLPFLVTRIYAGAGGVHWPTGDFLAGVRVHFLAVDTGGETMRRRAIHSTARDEPLTGDPQRFGWRYHTVLGDGLRSHFSQLLRFGVTALVLQAITAFPDGLSRFPVPGGTMWSPSFWLRSAWHFNVLERDAQGLHVRPAAMDVQRVYLELVDRFVSTLTDPPAWMRQVATVWESTLNALERRDNEWLCARLDPWIKYELFSEYLRSHQADWDDVATNVELACGMAILNQDYHEFTNSNSAFRWLEDQGRLAHRIGPKVAPGREAEPFVPQFGTRATARARFTKQHCRNRGIIANWDRIDDTTTGRAIILDDPLSADFTIQE